MRNLRSRNSSTTWRRSRRKRRDMSPVRRTSKSSMIGSKRRASELLFLKRLLTVLLNAYVVACSASRDRSLISARSILLSSRTAREIWRNSNAV